MVEVGAEGLHVEVQSQVREDFGIEVKNLTPAEHDHKQNQVLIGDSAVVRISLDSPSQFGKEQWVYGVLKAHDIPCADVLAYSENPPTIKKPTIVLSRVPGETMTNSERSPEDEAEYYQQAGSLLRKIHQIPVEGFGYLVPRDGTYKGKYSSWIEHLERRNDRIEEYKGLRERGFISEEELQAILSAFATIKERKAEKPSLLHNDYHGKNILVDNGQISGVIDLCNSLAGDPMLDVATSLFFQSESQRRAFLTGYGDVDKEVVKQYMIFIAGSKIVSRLAAGNPDRANVARERLQILIKND